MSDLIINQGFITASYLSASILFILSLGGLSSQESARRGNLFGMLGMAIALIATIASKEVTGYGLIILTMGVGTFIGGVIAYRVKMTNMPQLVAILHSFVGLAAVFVGFSTHLSPSEIFYGLAKTIHNTEIYIGIFIGMVTFSGSVIAFGKLQGTIRSRPVILPARHVINLAAVGIIFWLGYLFVGVDSLSFSLKILLTMSLIAFLFGWHLVMAIGGADMPVVISMLNSYSGWAAAATGFMLGNDLLIIAGALVGSSGAILAHIMCTAMNRRLFNVILGGVSSKKQTKTKIVPTGEVQVISSENCASLLKKSSNVVIVPGYGMAVAQAQHPVYELTKKLEKSGSTVRFAIHPVAGRMPGHMNVLLAESNVPYDCVIEMDEINDDFPEVDVVLVIGANDIVNPSAIEDPESPISGMPVLEVWNARSVIVLKRTMGTGYAGVENPLFFKNNTRMLFGDAKESIYELLRNI